MHYADILVIHDEFLGSTENKGIGTWKDKSYEQPKEGNTMILTNVQILKAKHK